MTADRALAEDDEAAREYVGALDRDRYRQLHVCRAEKVRRPHADALAAGDIHRVDRDLPSALREMIFPDRRKDGGLFPLIDHACGQRARRVHRVNVAAHSRQRFLDAFELADRRLELRAHTRIASGRAHDHLRHACIERWQRDRAPRRKALHQHPPAFADHRLAPDHPVDRNEDVPSPVRAVLEHRRKRHVPPPDIDARVAGGDQRAGDAQVFLVAEQMIGIKGAEREPQNCRDRPERDVALLPGKSQAQYLPALVLAHADDASIGNCCGVRPRVRIGERETGNL